MSTSLRIAPVSPLCLSVELGQYAKIFDNKKNFMIETIATW